jgi:hypothetical protein
MLPILPRVSLIMPWRAFLNGDLPPKKAGTEWAWQSSKK